VSELFRDRFGQAPDGVWLAPGRANLMGEHTDYNDGFVLPFALGQHIVTAAARRDDGRLAVTSRQEKDAGFQVEMAELEPGSVTGWGAYPAGVAWALREAGYPVPGASIAIDSDVPAGAGLSSSAALECATALALTELAGLDGPAPNRSIPRRELAAIARRAENEFVGVPSGIMDQSASLLCQAGHLLLLDCRSLETAQVAFDPAPAGAQLLIVNTRARHELSDGEYGERRAECEEAARQLGVASLRDVTSPAEVGRLTDPVLRRRARHVVSDNQRVLAVVELLRSGPSDDGPSDDGPSDDGPSAPAAYREIGRLLTQAHESLRDDFEISWPEADETVAAAVGAGAFGARMIGGGFGGSVLVLAGPGSRVTTAVSEAFARRGWTPPEFLEATPSDSARRVG
jgi:galactokinase